MSVTPLIRTEWEFWLLHDGHDVGTRHEDGRLFSATCHTEGCDGAWFYRPFEISDIPAASSSVVDSLGARSATQ